MLRAGGGSCRRVSPSRSRREERLTRGSAAHRGGDAPPGATRLGAPPLQRTHRQRLGSDVPRQHGRRAVRTLRSVSAGRRERGAPRPKRSSPRAANMVKDSEEMLRAGGGSCRRVSPPRSRREERLTRGSAAHRGGDAPPGATRLGAPPLQRTHRQRLGSDVPRQHGRRAVRTLRSVSAGRREGRPAGRGGRLPLRCFSTEHPVGLLADGPHVQSGAAHSAKGAGFEAGSRSEPQRVATRAQAENVRSPSSEIGTVRRLYLPRRIPRMRTLLFTVACAAAVAPLAAQQPAPSRRPGSRPPTTRARSGSWATTSTRLCMAPACAPPGCRTAASGTASRRLTGAKP